MNLPGQVALDLGGMTHEGLRLLCRQNANRPVKNVGFELCIDLRVIIGMSRNAPAKLLVFRGTSLCHRLLNKKGAGISHQPTSWQAYSGAPLLQSYESHVVWLNGISRVAGTDVIQVSRSILLWV
jgi:hypothetical protein